MFPRGWLSAFGLVFWASRALAGPADVHGFVYSLEPVVGYESQRKDNPTGKKLILTYGGRLVAGFRAISFELEYTQGRSDDYFSDRAERIHEKTEKFRYGFRSSHAFGAPIDGYLRVGVEGQRLHSIRTLADGSTLGGTAPWKAYPYVGFGLGIDVSPRLNLNGGLITTLKSLGDADGIETTMTFGARFTFGR